MLPSFVYDEKSYDPHNILKGLFRGFFLVRVFRHIFTGPRTALKVTDGPIAGKPWNAQILGMLSVTKYSSHEHKGSSAFELPGGMVG